VAYDILVIGFDVLNEIKFNWRWAGWSPGTHPDQWPPYVV